MATCTFTTAGSLCVLSFFYENAFKNITSLKVAEDASNLVNASLIAKLLREVFFVVFGYYIFMSEKSEKD